MVVALGCLSFKHSLGVRSKPAYLSDSTVALVTQNPFKGFEYYPYCAGVWISENQFLTAHHCIIHEDDEKNLIGKMVKFKTRREISINRNELTLSNPHWGLVIAIDVAHDLALINSIDLGLKHKVTRLRESSIEVGEEVKIVGHTSGLAYTYMVGIISAEREDFPEKGDHFFQISAAAYKGNSGGGVFDKSGNLIGICSSLFNRAPNIILFVHRDEVVKFLRENGGS